MCKFTASEFHKVWMRPSDHVSENWNVGKGQKPIFTGKDLSFISMGALSHGQQWEFTAQLFITATSTLEWQTTKYLQIVCPVVFENYVLRCEEKWTMQKFERMPGLSIFFYARYTIVVTFEQSSRLSGNMGKTKIFLEDMNFMDIKLKYQPCRPEFASNVLYTLLPSFLV